MSEQKIKDLEAKLKKAEEETKASDQQIEALESDLAKRADESKEVEPRFHHVH